MVRILRFLLLAATVSILAAGCSTDKLSLETIHTGKDTPGMVRTSRGMLAPVYAPLAEQLVTDLNLWRGRHMKILAIEHETPGVTAEDFQPQARAEAARVWELQQAGILREIYFRADRNQAVLILECTDVDQADQALGSLPLVKAGLIAFEVIPLKPYPGLSRLFAEEPAT